MTGDSFLSPRGVALDPRGVAFAPPFFPFFLENYLPTSSSLGGLNYILGYEVRSFA